MRNSCVSHSCCNLCENPYPYQCHECTETIAESLAEKPALPEVVASIQKGRSTVVCGVSVEVVDNMAKRVYIGSGEDAFHFNKEQQA